jgi:tetratricopeptide (TPR) repeat protein
MADRKKIIEKKREGSDVLRLRGNTHYKKKDYKVAVVTYKEALKALPYSCKILLNIAQCCIKLIEYEDALEYLSRVIYLEKDNAKVSTIESIVLI